MSKTGASGDIVLAIFSSPEGLTSLPKHLLLASRQRSAFPLFLFLVLLFFFFF
jgi:hypothetical protein